MSGKSHATHLFMFMVGLILAGEAIVALGAWMSPVAAIAFWSNA